MVQWLVDNLFTQLSGFLEFLNGVFTGDWDRAFSGIIQIGENLRDIYFSIFDFIQNKIMKPFDKFLQGIFATDWSTAFGVVGDILNGFYANVRNIWNSIKQIFNGIITFVRGAFTGNWRQAWEGIKQIFAGVFNGLVAIAKFPINGIISAINGLIRGVVTGINTVIRALNRLHFSIPSWVPVFGGRRFGFNIGTISAPQIPHLASGAVIPPNQEFLAVLGDQKQGTNIEAPESLIRKIMREELAKQNSGGGSYAFTAQINRRTLFEEFIKEAQLQQMRTGKNPLDFA